MKTQIWCAVSTYVLIAIVKEELKLPHSMYTLLQILSVEVFEKTPILQEFANNDVSENSADASNQLILMGF